MYLLTYSYRSDMLRMRNQSVAIRAAYLLAEEIVIGGDLYKGILIKEILTAPTAQKAAEFMLKYSVGDEEKKELREIVAMLKGYKAIKHKTPATITSMKQLEKRVLQAWVQYREVFVGNFVKTGMTELEKIFKKDDTTFLGASSDPEKIAIDCYPCSKVLLLEAEEKNPPVEQSYFMLPAEYKQMHTDSRFDFHNWNEINLTFCNINVLTGAELVAVRQQLRPAAKPLCEAINKWSAMLPNMTPEQSYGWYQQFVKPAAAALQQAIDTNELLNTINRLANDDAKVCIHIGEAPTQAMWMFFDMHQSIPEATKRVLEKPEAINFGAKRKPYFAVSYVNWQNVSNDRPNAEQEITAVKKSIVFE